MIDFGLAKKHNDSMKKLETKAGTVIRDLKNYLIGLLCSSRSAFWTI